MLSLQHKFATISRKLRLWRK